jgi:hypothetical protein
MNDHLLEEAVNTSDCNVLYLKSCTDRGWTGRTALTTCHRDIRHRHIVTVDKISSVPITLHFTPPDFTYILCCLFVWPYCSFEDSIAGNEKFDYVSTAQHKREDQERDFSPRDMKLAPRWDDGSLTKNSPRPIHLLVQSVLAMFLLPLPPLICSLG